MSSGGHRSAMHCPVVLARRRLTWSSAFHASTRMKRLLSTTVVCLLLAGCATVPDTLHEREALLQRDREWAVAAAHARDVERIVSFRADDATILPPDAAPVHGKVAIRDYVQKSLAIPGFQIQ